MNTKQRIKENMLLSVDNFGNKNLAIVQSIPKLSSCFELLKKRIDEIQSVGQIQGTNKTGLALDKKRLKKKLIELTIKYANRATVLATQLSNDTLLKEVRINEWDLGKSAGVAIVERSQLIYDRVEANIASLSDQAVTPDTQKEFQDTITAFKNAIASPRSGITARKQATEKISLLFDAVDAELDIMDLVVRTAKEDYPDFYTGYKNSRMLIDLGTGSLALRASAKEIVSGAPLSGVEFTFRNEADGGKGNGEIVKKTSKMGSFHLKSMDSGTYRVTINKDGYKEKELSVSVTDGERSDLNVELEKT
jgi:Carboxypeptidase regulatory-like domain